MFRIGSAGSRLFLSLFLLLFVIGLVLVLAGVDLDKVDLWLDDRAGLFDLIGSRLFNVLSGAVLALCVLTVAGGLRQKFVSPRSQIGDAAEFVVEPAAGDELVEEPARPVGWGCMFLAVIVGYFAWFGMTG
jgi:hypothetical protein